jgi:hypothetical protein
VLGDLSPTAEPYAEELAPMRLLEREYLSISADPAPGSNPSATFIAPAISARRFLKAS